MKRFFFYYGINRHKATTLTPSYHAESYSPDDNRFDLRPFLYPAKWSRQFKVVDEMAMRYQQKARGPARTAWCGRAHDSLPPAPHAWRPAEGRRNGGEPRCSQTQSHQQVELVVLEGSVK